MEKGQTSLEYALILAGVLTIIAIATGVILSTTQASQEGVETGIQGFNSAAIDQEVGAYGVKIISPTEDEPVFVDAITGDFNVTMIFGSEIVKQSGTYDLDMIKGNTAACKTNISVTAQKMTVKCPASGPLNLAFVGGVNAGDKISLKVNNNGGAHYREYTAEDAVIAT